MINPIMFQIVFQMVGCHYFQDKVLEDLVGTLHLLMNEAGYLINVI